MNAKNLLIFLFFIFLLLKFEKTEQKEQLMRNDIEENPDKHEGKVGLYEDNKEALSVKDKMESDHFMPQAAVEKAVVECHKDENCRNSDTAKKLDRLLNLEMTLSLKKSNHEKTPSFGRNSDALAEKLKSGNFKEAFSMQADAYREVFGADFNEAISQLEEHFDKHIISDDVHNEEHGAQGQQSSRNANKKKLSNFNKENKDKSPDEQREAYGEFARQRIDEKAETIKKVLSSPNSMSLRKANLLEKKGENIEGYNVKKIVVSRNSNRNVNSNVRRSL